MTEASIVRADRLRLTAHPTLNDAWLRERIVEDPSVLDLGDLRLADEVRLRDGRLELLLRDPQSGRRFTVLVRVGAAEEADLVRAIEHWTIERERYPEHEHFAVIVAEELPPRFLSAATTLGGTFPLSAMQVSALRVGEHIVLHFSLVLDRLPPRECKQGNGNGRETHQPRIKAEPAGEEASAAVRPDSQNTAEGSNGNTAVAENAGATTAPAAASPDPRRTGETPTHLAATDPWDAGLDARPDASDEERTYARARRRTAGSRVFSLICLLSLLLCLGGVAGWLRSYVARDVFTFSNSAGRDHVIYSDQGRLDWIVSSGEPSADGGQRYIKIPYWLPVGITAILPIAWLIRRR